MRCIAGLAIVLLVAFGTSSAGAVSVKRGAHYGGRVFPDNAFTTRTASGELVRIRKALDRMPASTFSFAQNGVNDVFLAASVAPSVAEPVNGIVRADQVKADPKASGAFRSSAVPNLIPTGGAG